MSKVLKPRSTHIKIHEKENILDLELSSLNPTLHVKLNPKRNITMTRTMKMKKMISL